MSIGIPLVILCLLQMLLPLGTAVQIGADEGFELVKATLCSKGYKLYTEVWNDQPPLHTYLVTQLISHFSGSLLATRLLTSAFSLLLLFSYSSIVERISGYRTALVASLLIIASPGFIELSASCMLEIPALSMALVGICLVIRLGSTRWMWSDIVAGVLFGLALQMKLISLIWTPVVGLIVVLQTNASERVAGHGPNERWGFVSRSFQHLTCEAVVCRVGAFAASLAISWILIDYLVADGAYMANFHQTWRSHFAGTKTNAFGSPEDHPFKWSLLIRNWDTSLFAVIGATWGIFVMRKNRQLLLPLCWLMWTLFVFSNHKPWWPYYYIHIAVPLCWCAAIGFSRLIPLTAAPRNHTPLSRYRLRFVLIGVLVFLASLWMMARVYLQISSIRRLPRTYSSLVIAEAERYRPFCRSMFAENIVYSFHIGLPMPPNLAVIPAKRLWSEQITTEQIVADLRRLRPEMVLLSDHSFDTLFQGLLDRDYQMVFQDSSKRLYVRNDVVEMTEHTWRK